MSPDEWFADAVTTRAGTVLPVRATARRPSWADLAPAVRAAICSLAGSDVIRARSAGTGFTSGFASRLDLADGRQVFVKAASASADAALGWHITASYREEIRKLRGLPAGVPAPRLMWWWDDDIDGDRWVVLGLQFIAGRPPRRPWRSDELAVVVDTLTATAPALATAPAELSLPSFVTEFGDVEQWANRVVERDGTSAWLDHVIALGRESLHLCSGTAMAHLDLRDDNILLSPEGRVWICDWNWPLRAAPWLDLVTLLISAHGDGLDVDTLVTVHPLTAGVSPRAVDAWLAILWLYFTAAKERPVPANSPHIRDHQLWYDEVTRDWLERRLAHS